MLITSRRAGGLDPERTGPRPFLAGGPDGSSGIMILEYTASAALAELRGLAAPSSLGTAVLSRGAEEHAAADGHRAAARITLPVAVVSRVSMLRNRLGSFDPDSR